MRSGSATKRTKSCSTTHEFARVYCIFQNTPPRRINSKPHNADSHTIVSVFNKHLYKTPYPEYASIVTYCSAPLFSVTYIYTLAVLVVLILYVCSVESGGDSKSCLAKVSFPIMIYRPIWHIVVVVAIATAIIVAGVLSRKCFNGGFVLHVFCLFQSISISLDAWPSLLHELSLSCEEQTFRVIELPTGCKRDQDP